MTDFLLSSQEISLARHCLDFALESGASKIRITLSKSQMNLVGVLNGEVDKVSSTLDRSIQFQIFAGSRYGSFSSNRLEKEELEKFILEAIDTVKMLEEDTLRDLPSPQRLEKNARTGLELGLWDSSYKNLDQNDRRRIILSSSIWPRKTDSYELISEEGEYSDTVFDTLTIDSQGLEARHMETSFEIGFESTIKDKEGNIYSSFWWDAAPLFKDLVTAGCAGKALEKAVAQIAPEEIPGGKYTIVVDTECASKLLSPLMNALGGYSLQQKNSFLEGSLGKKIFPESLTIMDVPREKGATGSRLFDSEGVATVEGPIIEKGVIKKYFLNTYIAAKMGMEPTQEDAIRVKVEPIGGCRTLEDVLSLVGDCILVTGFNGGNSSPATGNFSYGIEGFLVKGGKAVHPVREMLLTGNFISLWNNIIAAAQDARACMSRLIPTIAFKDTDICA